MPLSEHEQRLLDEIEQALYAEDPKFASSVRAARRHRRFRSSVLLGILGVLVGLGLVLVGLLANVVAVSVVGFVLLVAGFGYGAQSLRHRSATGSASASGAVRRSGTSPRHPALAHGRPHAPPLRRELSRALRLRPTLRTHPDEWCVLT